MARAPGLDAADSRPGSSTGPTPTGSTDRERVLLTATDEFVDGPRRVTAQTWQRLASHLDRQQLIEFCMLAGQYDGLAATMATLQVPLDFPRLTARYR